MAGIIDKIKGMFGGAKSGSGSSGMNVDSIKEQAGDVKDQVDELADKAGDKLPDQVKDTYEKVSDQAEKIIPGDKPADAPEAGGQGGQPAS